ncbi:ATP-binding protein [Brevundimonas sp. Leaf363]|uniref:ATP-binding protein n=1 Tax=Brevundimonas sp. Leaf363 TaxID=1736353 RepID=UPI000AE9805A|nr:ATP-binding protein [Brevundimonas sp. Leaf363]
MATNPGLHANVRMDVFSYEERRIVEELARFFYITTGNEETVSGSRYTYVAARPSHLVEHALPNAREFLVLFADYENFEARTLQAFDQISNYFADHLRINRHFRILASTDPGITDKMRKICADEPDIPVTLPFTYNVMLSKNVGPLIIDATRENYFFRDLFSQRDPLRESTYFFGRTQLLAAMRDRMARTENSGVFGLRKSGKTSILLACERLAKTDGHRFIHVDCQSASTTAARWNELLRALAIEVRKAAGLAVTPVQLGEFSPTEASKSFEKAIADAYSQGKKKTIIAFDEVEHISPQTGVGHWRSGEDTLLFWQTVRSIHQRMGSRMSFIVAGTNPIITECREIYGSDNPLLAYIAVEYLPGLTDDETQQMCQSLGGLMGMNFTVEAVAFLYASMGGHAFLTRQIASHIHRNLPFEGRPVEITPDHVEAAIQSFDFKPLFDDVLAALKARFPDEFQLLQWSALGDHDKVQEFIDLDPAYATHLIGYGLVRQVAGSLAPRMRLVTDYLRSTAKVSGVIKNDGDRWAVIAKRRGELEIELRSAVRSRIIDGVGKSQASDEIRKRMNRTRADQIADCSLEDIFSASDCRLYFSDLISIMDPEWSYWERRLGIDASELKRMMIAINQLRYDAHAKVVSDSDFDLLLDYLDSLQAAL